MRREERFDDRDLNRLFEGDVPSDDERLGSLAAFVREARTAYTETPDEALEARHLAAITEASHQQTAPAPVRDRSSDPRSLRRKRMLSTLFASLGAKVAAAALIVTASTGALAATGTLPDPVQNAVANAADNVGLNLPGGDDEVPEVATEGQQTAQEKQEAAEAYADAVRSWTNCVKEGAEAHEGPEAFDPEEACGEKPQPQAFGLSNVPEQGQEGRERGEQERDAHQPDTADQNRQDEGQTPEDPASSGDDARESGESNNPTGNNESNTPSAPTSGSDAGDQGQSQNPTGHGPQ